MNCIEISAEIKRCTMKLSKFANSVLFPISSAIETLISCLLIPRCFRVVFLGNKFDLHSFFNFLLRPPKYSFQPVSKDFIEKYPTIKRFIETPSAGKSTPETWTRPSARVL